MVYLCTVYGLILQRMHSGGHLLKSNLQSNLLSAKVNFTEKYHHRIQHLLIYFQNDSDVI